MSSLNSKEGQGPGREPLGLGTVTESTEDAPIRNPSPPSEDFLSEKDKTLLEADTISNTVFSKHWVFSILMKLLQQVENESKQESEKGQGESSSAVHHGIDINEDLENDLCSLWDMTVNPEVAKFLQEWKSPEIFLSIISKTNAPRVTEICIGVLGNMACCPDIRKEFSKNQLLIDVSLNLLGGSDSPTMIETSRLIYTCLNDEECATKWLETVKRDQDVLRSITFILQSSTNCDLIHNVADLLDELLDLDDELLQMWSGPLLIQAITEALMQISNDRHNTVSLLHHSLQVISTTDSGVDGLVELHEKVLPLLEKFIAGVFEDGVLSMSGKENTLASVISVLSVLMLRSNDIPQQLSQKECRTIKQVAEMLYAIHRKEVSRPRKTSASDKESSSAQNQSTNDASGHRTKEQPCAQGNDKQGQGGGGGNGCQGNSASSRGSDGGCRGDDGEEEEEREKIWLTELLKDQLIDFFCCAIDIAKKSKALQSKLHTCGTQRLNALRECLPDDRNDLLDLLDTVQGK